MPYRWFCFVGFVLGEELNYLQATNILIVIIVNQILVLFHSLDMSTEEYHLCLSFRRDSPNSENTSSWISSWFVQWVLLSWKNKVLYWESMCCSPCFSLHLSPFSVLAPFYLPSSLSPYEFSYVLQFLLNSLRVSCNILCLSLWQY